MSNLFIQFARYRCLFGMRLCLFFGYDIDFQDDFGRTALMYIAETSNVKCISFLVSRQANINIKDREGQTAIIRACIYNNLDVVKFLLEHNAHFDNNTIRHSVNNHNLEIVKLLLSYNVDSRGCLEIACRYGYFSIAVELLRSGCFIDMYVIKQYKILWIVTEIEYLNYTCSERLDEFFRDDPYLWTIISRQVSKRVFRYFIHKYADLLRISPDIVWLIFK